MMHWNKAFWLLFVVIGAIVVAGLIVRILYLDLLLGFLVISIGLLKLGEELSSQEIKDKHSDINDNIRYLSHQVDAGNQFARRVKERHEHRFLRLDNRRTDIESIIDDKYDSLAKKFIQLENRANDIAKALVEVSKRHDIHVKKTTDDLKHVKKLKERTDKMSEKLRYVRAPRPKATQAAMRPTAKPATRSASRQKAGKKALKASKAKK
jgi:hypothetical protein